VCIHTRRRKNIKKINIKPQTENQFSILLLVEPSILAVEVPTWFWSECVSRSVPTSSFLSSPSGVGKCCDGRENCKFNFPQHLCTTIHIVEDLFRFSFRNFSTGFFLPLALDFL
jgi:hypothetical protein